MVVIVSSSMGLEEKQKNRSLGKELAQPSYCPGSPGHRSPECLGKKKKNLTPESTSPLTVYLLHFLQPLYYMTFGAQLLLFCIYE